MVSTHILSACGSIIEMLAEFALSVGEVMW